MTSNASPMPGELILESFEAGESSQLPKVAKPSHTYEIAGPPDSMSLTGLANRWGVRKAGEARTRLQQKEQEGSTKGRAPKKPAAVMQRVTSSGSNRKTTAAAIVRSGSSDVDNGLDRPVGTGGDRPGGGLRGPLTSYLWSH